MLFAFLGGQNKNNLISLKLKSINNICICLITILYNKCICNVNDDLLGIWVLSPLNKTVYIFLYNIKYVLTDLKTDGTMNNLFEIF